MKTFYFVRHGESEVNVGDYFVNDQDAPLTERGREQAAAAAKRFASIPIDAMISSTMRRTVETATIISEAIHKPFERSDVFVERRIPPEVFGRLRNDKEVVQIMDEWSEALISDGESFTEIKDRTGRALQLLEKRPESHILVVTHGYFLRMLLAHLFFGDSLTPHEARKVVESIASTQKSHITIFHYYEDGRQDPWKLWVWNDHAHLG